VVLALSNPAFSIKSLLSGGSRKVADMVAELESSRDLKDAVLWTDRLTPSTKGGKEGPA
jgi:hypothetical protein